MVSTTKRRLAQVSLIPWRPKGLRQYPPSSPPPPPTTASLLPPTQSRFTPVSAQLPHTADALLQCMQPQPVAGYCRRRRVLACVRVRDVDASLPIARHPPSSILTLFLPPNVARTTRERLPLLFCPSAQQQESSPYPKLLPRSCGTGLSVRSDGRRCPSLVWDSTTLTGRLSSLHLLCITSTPRRAPAAYLHPVLPAGLFATNLISSRRALPHLDYATMRFRGDAGSRRCACAAAGPAGSSSFWGSLPPYSSISTRMACSPVRRIRPSRISTARRGVRGGASALQLGDVHTAAWIFGTPQTVYRACGIHFTLLQARCPARVPVHPSGPKSSSTPGFIGDLL
ncbi:hypothetical protein B0H14DRAFT_3903136 [Mycena olivaceomarginata]|nr:hypothetical protein B0H14DRAFT_3903136 [Mycena olivaceomarginata]